MDDILIRVREGVLDFVSGSNARRVLNESEQAIEGFSGERMLAELGECLLAIRSSGFSENGQRINYRLLGQSDAYRKFKREIAPQLNIFNLNFLNSREMQLAFWINIYNMLTIDAVISRKIKTSVTEGWMGLSRFFRSAAYQIDGQRFSLEDIEHGILRSNKGNPYLPGEHFPSNDSRKPAMLKEFDPRIHFALNCASTSCPPIAFYQVEDIESQLDLASKSFIEAECQLSDNGRGLRISSIFKWYAKDFGGDGEMRRWIAQWLPVDDPRGQLLLEEPNVQLQFNRYRWELNK